MKHPYLSPIIPIYKKPRHETPNCEPCEPPCQPVHQRHRIQSCMCVCVCMRLLLPDLVHIQQSKSLCPEHTFKHTQVLIGCHFIHYYHDERNRERSQQIRRCAGNGAHCGRPSRWPSVYSRTTALLPRSIALCTNDGIATSRPTDQYQSPVVPHLWYCRYPGVGHYSRSHCHLPRRQCQTRNSEYRFERRAGTVSGQCWYCVRFRGVGFVDYPRGRLGGLVSACVVGGAGVAHQ